MLCTIDMLIFREPEVEVILLDKLHAIYFYFSLLFKTWAQKPLACAHHIRYAMLCYAIIDWLQVAKCAKSSLADSVRTSWRRLRCSRRTLANFRVKVEGGENMENGRKGWRGSTSPYYGATPLDVISDWQRLCRLHQPNDYQNVIFCA